MPVLENPRHELFAQHLASGKSAVDAYAAAGYSRDRGAASNLLSANINISQRVAELQRRNIASQDEKTAVTLGELQAMARKAYDLAVEVKRPADAVAALTAMAKLSGLWIERSERTSIKAPAQLSDEQLLERIAAADQGEPLQ